MTSPAGPTAPDSTAAPLAPVTTASAEHYVWGAQCDGWYLVRTAGLTVIQERVPPGAAEARHRHARARQFFFVLAGELRLDVEGTSHLLRAQTGLEVAPGQAHAVVNPHATEDAHFLVVSSPSTQGDKELLSPP